MDLGAIVSGFLTWAGPIAISFGYIGILFVNFIASSSIFLPVPAFLIVFAAGSILNPLLVGFSAAIGCALGELVGYGLGRGGRKIIEKKYKRFLEKYKNFLKKKIMFFGIILFAATPLPDDIVGIACGVFKYDVKKFLIASFIGKVIMNTALALGGYYGINLVIKIFGGL